MQVTVTIKTNEGKEYLFVIRIHKSTQPEEQQIEESFYTKNTPEKKVHQGTHYEMEIISPNLMKHAYTSKMHVHQSAKNNKQFICLTFHIDTEEKVRQAIECWCAGTVYTIENNDGFERIIKRHNLSDDDFAGILSKLMERYNICKVRYDEK